MKKIFFTLFIVPLSFIAQDDLKVKTSSFDYNAYGKTYEYEGEYVVSKESGSKEKLPHGKGKLTQPEKLEKAAMAGWVSGVEKFTKKGYAAEPYLYDGDWHMGQKHGVGEEKKFILEKGKPVIQEHYKGGYENGKFNGKGTLKTLNFEYTGDFKAGKKHGEGTIQIVNFSSPPTAQRIDLVKVKEKYEGSWNEDMFHGKGTFTSFEKKESFSGEFENHAFQKGLYTYKDGNTYDGEWKDGLPSGKGTYMWKSTGDIYVGEFLAGEPKGKGKLTKKDGSYFEGDFEEGNCTGKAKTPYKSKFYDSEVKGKEVSGVYEGEIKDNKPNGKGTFTSSKLVNYEGYDDDGNEIKRQVPEYSYTGGWQNGVKFGEGIFITYIYDDGFQSFDKLTYEGGFKNDLYEGDNSTLSKINLYSGFSYAGGFKSGKFHGFGKTDEWGGGDAGASYEGQFMNGEYHGEGILTWDHHMGSEVYKGTFENGYIVYGTCETYQNSEKPISVYSGSFSSGREHGNGKIEYFGKFDEYMEDWSDNKVKSYVGDWASGSPNGQGTMVYKNGTKVTGKFRDGEYLKPFSAPSVKIGNQTWMSQNLTVTKFRNGDPIPEAKTKDEWQTANKNGKPAFCYYNNDPSTAKTHGVLYNYYAVNDSRALAPEGWRVPSHIHIEDLFKIEFPNYFSDWKVITDKEAQGINAKADRDKLYVKYNINPATLSSVKTFSNQNKTYIHRASDGTFREVDYYGPVFWSSSYKTNNDNGVEIQVVKTVGRTKPSLQIFDNYNEKPNPPIEASGRAGESKNNGFAVRLIKID